MAVDLDWSESFFEGPWFELHLNMRNRSDIERECDSVEALLDLQPPSRIVDIPCGPGDHAIELARRGFRVTGVDRSQTLLDHASTRARGANASLDLVRGDMRTHSAVDPFDALICLWGSFGYFDTDGDLAVLRVFRDLIRPGGVLLLDLLPLEGILTNFEPKDSQRLGTMTVVQERSYDMLRQRVDGKWTFHVENERIVKYTSMRLYTVREALALLEESGFADIACFDPETRGPFEFGSARAWVRARRC